MSLHSFKLLGNSGVLQVKSRILNTVPPYLSWQLLALSPRHYAIVFYVLVPLNSFRFLENAVVSLFLGPLHMLVFQPEPSSPHLSHHLFAWVNPTHSSCLSLDTSSSRKPSLHAPSLERCIFQELHDTHTYSSRPLLAHWVAIYLFTVHLGLWATQG